MAPVKGAHVALSLLCQLLPAEAASASRPCRVGVATNTPEEKEESGKGGGERKGEKGGSQKRREKEKWAWRER